VEDILEYNYLHFCRLNFSLGADNKNGTTFFCLLIPPIARCPPPHPPEGSAYLQGFMLDHSMEVPLTKSAKRRGKMQDKQAGAAQEEFDMGAAAKAHTERLRRMAVEEREAFVAEEPRQRAYAERRAKELAENPAPLAPPMTAHQILMQGDSRQRVGRAQVERAVSSRPSNATMAAKLAPKRAPAPKPAVPRPPQSPEPARVLEAPSSPKGR